LYGIKQDLERLGLGMFERMEGIREYLDKNK
jgi:hypothetical protein